MSRHDMSWNGLHCVTPRSALSFWSTTSRRHDSRVRSCDSWSAARFAKTAQPCRGAMPGAQTWLEWLTSDRHSKHIVIQVFIFLVSKTWCHFILKIIERCRKCLFAHPKDLYLKIAVAIGCQRPYHCSCISCDWRRVRSGSESARQFPTRCWSLRQHKKRTSPFRRGRIVVGQ